MLSAVAQEATHLPSVESVDFDTNAEPKLIQPAQINLPPALAEVVRLAQSGAGESVTLAYIQKAPAYHIDSDEIIYLKDLGISEPILIALVEHSQTNAIATPVTVPEPEQTNAPPVVTPPLTPPAEVSEFYQPLTPYGSWVEVAPYGWCWQPTAAIIYRGWQPYCDNGYWLWSDYGWYWHSYYSWGWAPFHYGRWFNHPHRGWCWAPDRMWGPSWVCWRNSPGYAGWAPLPPGARFSVGVGWTHHGRAVGSSFGFGISSAHFAFVSTAHFTDRHVAARRLPPREVNAVFNKTTVANNYVTGSGNRVINRGVDLGGIEKASGTRLREVAVRELPPDRTRGTMPDRLTRQGESVVVYRPGPKIDMSRNPIPAPAARPPAVNRPQEEPGQQGAIRGTTPSVRSVQPTPAPEGRSGVPGTTVTPATPGAPKPRSAPQTVPPSSRPPPPATRSAPVTPAPSRPVIVPPSSQPNVRPPSSAPPTTPPAPSPPRVTPPSPGPPPSRSAPVPSQPRTRDDYRR